MAWTIWGIEGGIGLLFNLCERAFAIPHHLLQINSGTPVSSSAKHEDGKVQGPGPRAQAQRSQVQYTLPESLAQGSQFPESH